MNTALCGAVASVAMWDVAVVPVGGPYDSRLVAGRYLRVV